MRVSPLFSRRLFTCPSFQPLSRLSRLSKFRMTKAREKLHHKQQSGRLGGWALTFESTGGSFRSRGLGMLFSDQFSLNFCFTSPSRGYTTNAVDLSNKINFTSEAFTSLQHNKIPKFHGARSLWINLKFPNVPNPAVTPANKSCGSKGKTPAAPPPETIELRSESINITKFLLAQFAYSAHFSVRRQSIHQRKGEGIVPDRRGKSPRTCHVQSLR